VHDVGHCLSTACKFECLHIQLPSHHLLRTCLLHRSSHETLRAVLSIITYQLPTRRQHLGPECFGETMLVEPAKEHLLGSTKAPSVVPPVRYVFVAISTCSLLALLSISFQQCRTHQHLRQSDKCSNPGPRTYRFVKVLFLIHMLTSTTL